MHLSPFAKDALQILADRIEEESQQTSDRWVIDTLRGMAMFPYGGWNTVNHDGDSWRETIYEDEHTDRAGRYWIAGETLLTLGGDLDQVVYWDTTARVTTFVVSQRADFRIGELVFSDRTTHRASPIDIRSGSLEMVHRAVNGLTTFYLFCPPEGPYCHICHGPPLICPQLLERVFSAGE